MMQSQFEKLFETRGTFEGYFVLYVAKPSDSKLQVAIPIDSKLSALQFFSLHLPTQNKSLVNQETDSITVEKNLVVVCSTLIILKIISMLIGPVVFIVSNLFENLTMLSNFFEVNENSQVLDPLTIIWEGKTIKGFKSA